MTRRQEVEKCLVHNRTHLQVIERIQEIKHEREIPRVRASDVVSKQPADLAHELTVRDILKAVLGAFITRRKSKKNLVPVSFYWLQGVEVRCIVIKWVCNASKNLVFNQDRMAIGLNENINSISCIGGYFAIYQTLERPKEYVRQ